MILPMVGLIVCLALGAGIAVIMDMLCEDLRQ